MKTWESFRLVVGYLPEIDEPPKTAQNLGLRHRVAAVLEYGEVPYSQLYWDLVGILVENLPHDSKMFEIDAEIDKPPLVFTSLAAMREHVESPPRKFGVPFSRATFWLRGEAKALVNTEPWATVGGPTPYHDSWTFAIYRETDEVATMRDACYRVCAQHGLRVLEEMHGLAAPHITPTPFWKRLVKWLFLP